MRVVVGRVARSCHVREKEKEKVCQWRGVGENDAVVGRRRQEVQERWEIGVEGRRGVESATTRH